jgi:hypothetical protein
MSVTPPTAQRAEIFAMDGTTDLTSHRAHKKRII